ncbi:MAG TPA: APC family permease [Pseudonocardia sp.]|nr:APC family permease [Pseudonocardia sp.]
MTDVQAVPPKEVSDPSGKGLKGGALGLVSSIVVGIASTAPAYSLAATLGLVVATANGDGIVGVKAPGVMLLAFIPMYFIAVAYSELNSREPDCGTTFTWATRAFGPWWGWMGGWGIIAADVIVMSNLAQIAGRYGFLLFGADGLADSTFWTTVAGVLWIAVMTYICYRGIEVSARLQYALLGIEVVVLVAFAGFALAKVFAGEAPEGSITPSLSWLWPSGVSLAALVPAFLLAVFIYWGWDTAVATNEECDDPAKTPGRAAILSTVLLLAIYTLVSVSAVAFAGTGSSGIGLANQDNADDVFKAIGPAVFGESTIGKLFEALLLISVLTSASASTQTTILPTARTSLSMGVFDALPRRFAKIHPRYLTPTESTVWMGIVSIVFYVGLTLVSSNILADSIAAVGLMIAFYYGLTGFACVWYFRRTLTTGVRNFVMRGVLPLLGGLILLGAFIESSIQYAAPDFGKTTLFGIGGVFVIGIGTLVFGVLLMFLWRWRAPGYFVGETLSKATPEYVLEQEGAEGPGLRLPDSHEAIVIAPDLSNLPPGRHAIDVRTHEELPHDEERPPEGPPTR